MFEGDSKDMCAGKFPLVLMEQLYRCTPVHLYKYTVHCNQISWCQPGLSKWMILTSERTGRNVPSWQITGLKVQGQTKDKHRTDNRQTPDRVYVLCPVALNIIFLNMVVNFNFVPRKCLTLKSFETQNILIQEKVWPQKMLTSKFVWPLEIFTLQMF